MVVHNLAHSIQTLLSQGSIEPSHVRWHLESIIWIMNSGAIIPLIAVDPCAIQTYHEAFPLGRHCVCNLISGANHRACVRPTRRECDRSGDLRWQDYCVTKSVLLRQVNMKQV